MSLLVGKTILVVDDEVDLREAVAYEFELRGCTVLQAGSGRAALDIMTHHAPIHIVLSDIRMPNGDGVELLTEIRRRCPGIPIVALVTGFSDHKDETLITIGAIEVFRKPIKMDLVLAVLENALAAG